MGSERRDSVEPRPGPLCLCIFGLLVLWAWPASAQVVSGSYVGTYTAGRKITGLGFRPDLVLVKGDDNCGGCEIQTSAVMRTSTMGAGDASKPLVGSFVVVPATTTDPIVPNQITSIDADGFTLGSDRRVAGISPNNTTFHWAAFKANANMKVGKYTGDGNPSQAIVVGVGFQPDFVIVLPENNR